ncbi:MAG TPA: uroporphyrinogen decarboxylase family protein [Caldilineaceae bacterium]|nr:uroporphyrinogen decarboxylase family protein [Caldilineaceae bacterium]
MNNRERFNATMHYQSRDRAPITDFGFWTETFPLWYKQGLPRRIKYSYAKSNHVSYFGMDFGLDAISRSTDVRVGLSPYFRPKILEDRDDHEIVQQSDGVRVLRRKFMGSIPQHQGHLLTDRESWEKHYKPRLDPNHPRRLPNDWDARVKAWQDPDRSEIIALPGGSLYGWIRNWMGVQNVSYLVYDDPKLFDEMVTTIADCIIGTLERALASGVQFDGCGMWEDMCYSSGPLLSPKHFKQYLVPHYRRITDLLHKHGVDVVWLDCDGDISLLVPMWLDAGVNCMFPLEVGTWRADPIKYRREYGKDLLIMGGFDKHLLQGNKAQIEAEVQRLAPLVDEGGFIGFCDHRVPPDVPLENYLFYLSKVRDIWGHGVNLPPMQC